MYENFYVSVHTLSTHNCVALTLLWLQSQVYRIEEHLNQYLILILSVLFVHCGMQFEYHCIPLVPPHLSHCLEWTVLHRNKSSIKMWVCNLKGTGTSASGVGVPVLVQHGPDVCPASLQALYNPALSPLPRFHGYRTNPSGLWKCSSVIQPLLLLQRLIECF